MHTQLFRRVEPSLRGDSGVGRKPGRGCDEIHMRWEKAEAEGKPGFEEGIDDGAEDLIHAEIEQAEQIGSLNPRLAGSLNELGILYAKHHMFKQAERVFQRALGVCVAVLGTDHPDLASI